VNELGSLVDVGSCENVGLVSGLRGNSGGGLVSVVSVDLRVL